MISSRAAYFLGYTECLRLQERSFLLQMYATNNIPYSPVLIYKTERLEDGMLRVMVGIGDLPSGVHSWNMLTEDMNSVAEAEKFVTECQEFIQGITRV